MKSSLKKALSVLMAVLLLFSSALIFAGADDGAYTPVSPGDMLHTEGEDIVNANGETVILRGTNFGGWGIMEDWFTPFTNPAGEEGMYQTLVSRFGVQATHELFKTYRSNWITEQDYKNVADIGMNCIRLPIWYRNFQSDDNGTWYLDENGEIDFSELDEAVRLCKKYGLYLIIDLHGLPGYQNDYDHCGQSKSMSLFDDTAKAARYREVVKDFWVTVAARYAGEPTVAMYDLMNEPLGTNITRDTDFQQAFWDFSNELYEAVRAVDPNHIITMEAIWSPSAIASPDVYGWENIVYQEHLYDVTNISYLAKVNEIRRAGFNSPFLIGEFYPRGISSFDYLFSIFNSRNLSWTTWTYKGAGDNADTSPWFIYGSSSVEKVDYENDSYDTLMLKWGECLRTDSGEFSKTAFADYVSYYVDGTIDYAALYSFGTVDSVGTFAERWNLLVDKLKAIYTTILDWIRKLSTVDLL